MAINFITSNTCRDLIHNINTTHTKYLREDKPSSEIKYRRCLEEYIREFLCCESHVTKFTFSRVPDILRKNVKSECFNALKAAEVWSTLSMYARNLYNQPWRPEFFEIKLYSGFYKHQIESHLSNAESILELMGYKRIGDRLVINEPIDKERLRQVSLDTLKAKCECQILFTIYEELAKQLANVTYADILKHRESSPGPAEQTIRDILCRTPASFCVDCCPDASLRRYSHLQSYLPTMNGHSANFRFEIPCRYSNACRYSNGYCDYGRTDKLIDFDDENDGSRSNRHNRKSKVEQPMTNENQSRFLNLFHTGSSNSLVDNRSSRKSETRKDDDLWNYLNKESGQENAKNKSYHQSSSSQSRSYLRSNGASETPNVSTLRLASDNVDNSVETLVDGREHGIKKPNFIELNKANVSSKKADRSQTWACPYCTYNNAKTSDVCKMCSKSRNVTEEAPLESGGKHCSRCTLVNKKEAMKCEACQESLKNSPTYV